jgi:superfamily II DNA/RNA helicase
MTFSDLELNDALVQALDKKEFRAPTAIQCTAIPALMNGVDASICSPTGTGKTLAYLLPILNGIDVASKDLQLMIFTPTHELASQVIDEIRSLAQLSGLPIRSQLLIGGVSNKRQIENLKKKPHVVAGSAGRMQELIRMRKLKVQKIRTIVIDEADRMLFDESLETIQRIINELQTTPQFIFASATEQPDSQAVMRDLAPNVQKVNSQANEVASDISHVFFEVRENDKLDFCRKLIRACDPVRAIVFVHKNETGQRLSALLLEHSIRCATLDSTADKNDRVSALRKFRKAEITVLVSTDIAARGLDVRGVSHVINLDAPHQSKQYLHRAGRTGRAGDSGICMTLIDRADDRLVNRYQKELGITFQGATLRHGEIRMQNE